MPRRVVFTNPLTGRFVSAAEALELEQSIRSVFDGGLVESQLLSYGRVYEDLSQTNEPNWDVSETARGTVWSTDDDLLDMSALQDAEPPEDASHFRVWYDVEGDPSYPRRWASSEWLPIENYEPSLDLLQGVSASGIRQIAFERR